MDSLYTGLPRCFHHDFSFNDSFVLLLSLWTAKYQVFIVWERKEKRKIMLENKTKQDDAYLDLESPLIDDARERRRLALEVEDQREEAEQLGEPFWFKILCCVGGVFPILRANGKFQCNCANIAWSILPFVWFSIWSYALVQSVSYLFQGSLTLGKLIFVLLCTFILILPLTLSYTRKSFSVHIKRTRTRKKNEPHLHTERRNKITAYATIYCVAHIGTGTVRYGLGTTHSPWSLAHSPVHRMARSTTRRAKCRRTSDQLHSSTTQFFFTSIDSSALFSNTLQQHPTCPRKLSWPLAQLESGRALYVQIIFIIWMMKIPTLT